MLDNKKEMKNTDMSGLEMYFSPEITKKFAELEQNEKNYKVAAIVDQIILNEIKNLKPPFHICELGGGAHPDRYHGLFDNLLKDPKGQFDWVDISPYMLDLAKNHLNTPAFSSRYEIINFIEKDILKYLTGLKDVELDVAIMKYTIDHIKDLDILFKLISDKLKPKGVFVATIGVLDPQLKSISTNARFLFQGKEFPINETRLLKDEDEYTVKFFKISGDPNSGYLEGAKTNKYYHSKNKINELANKFNFDIFLGNWKDVLKNDSRTIEKLDQNILILRKK